MKREETLQLLMTMQAAFPNYKVENKTATVNLWHLTLCEYDYQTVSAALLAYIVSDTSGFAPSIGQVLDKLREIQKPNRMTGLEAWNLLRAAIQNSGWEPVKQFNALPPDIQRVVGSPNQLRVWATDENFNANVVMSWFIKAYEKTIKRREEWESLPTAARKVLEGSMDRLTGTYAGEVEYGTKENRTM